MRPPSQESAQPALTLAAPLHDELAREVGVVDPLGHAGDLRIDPLRDEHLRHLFHGEVVAPDVDLADDENLLDVLEAALARDSGEALRCPLQLPVELFRARLEGAQHVLPDGLRRCARAAAGSRARRRSEVRMSVK